MLSILLFRISKSAGMYSPVISDILRVTRPRYHFVGSHVHHLLVSHLELFLRASSLPQQRRDHYARPLSGSSAGGLRQESQVASRVAGAAEKSRDQ